MALIRWPWPLGPSCILMSVASRVHHDNHDRTPYLRFQYSIAFTLSVMASSNVTFIPVNQVVHPGPVVLFIQLQALVQEFLVFEYCFQPSDGYDSEGQMGGGACAWKVPRNNKYCNVEVWVITGCFLQHNSCCLDIATYWQHFVWLYCDSVWKKCGVRVQYRFWWNWYVVSEQYLWSLPWWRWGRGTRTCGTCWLEPCTPRYKTTPRYTPCRVRH